MLTKKVLCLGSLVLALLTTLTWAQGPGQEAVKGNAFAPVQKQPAHVAPVLNSDPDRRQPAADTAYFTDDYRHHSLDEDAGRVHERRQHRHNAAAPHQANQPATTVADALGPKSR